MANEGLAERCKSFELAEAGRRATRGSPLFARLDGRAFHTFTRDLKRPYDEGMSRAMIETTRCLVHEANALVGYTQSDEITVVWHLPAESEHDFPFDGRFQKLASVLAGLASARFVQLLAEHLPGKTAERPHFDCRVWQVPTVQDALDVFVWREDDAVKNSVSMAAQAVFTDRELHGKDTTAKQAMLVARGVRWDDYPAFFKRGSYLQRRTFTTTLTEDELAKIPAAHRPAPGTMFERNRVVELELPPVRAIGNLAAVLLERADPAAR